MTLPDTAKNKNRPVKFKSDVVADIYNRVTSKIYTNKMLSKKVVFDETEDEVSITINYYGTYTKKKNSPAVSFKKYTGPDAEKYELSVASSHENAGHPIMWPFGYTKCFITHVTSLIGSSMDVELNKEVVNFKTSGNYKSASEEDKIIFRNSSLQAFYALRSNLTKSKKMASNKLKSSNSKWWENFVDKDVFSVIRRIYPVTSRVPINWLDYSTLSSRPDIDLVIKNVKSLGSLAPILRYVNYDSWHLSKDELPLEINNYIEKLSSLNLKYNTVNVILEDLFDYKPRTINDYLLIYDRKEFYVKIEDSDNKDRNFLNATILRGRLDNEFKNQNNGTFNPFSSKNINLDHFKSIDFLHEINALTPDIKKTPSSWITCSAMYDYLLDKNLDPIEYIKSVNIDFLSDRIKLITMMVDHAQSSQKKSFYSSDLRPALHEMAFGIIAYSDERGESFTMPDSHKFKDFSQKILMENSVNITAKNKKQKRLI